MKVLVLNSGSSSIKFRLFNMKNEQVMSRGTVDRIGIDNSFLEIENFRGEEYKIEIEIPDHTTGIEMVKDALIDKKMGVLDRFDQINAIGHRVVHGGEKFADSTLIDEEVVQQIIEVSELAPLHNPHNLKGIRICEEISPQKPQVAVFDTAFHQTMPQKAYMYALPYHYYQKYGIRRYGFHGISHKYVTQKAAEIMGRPIEELKLISCHLGNGASVAAVKNGKSIETSMGWTPLEGLVMGTRCGDLDPAIIPFIMEKEDITIEEMKNIMNKESGLLGISGLSSDSRDIRKAAREGHHRAQIALDLFNYQVQKYIGAYLFIMGGLDAIIFTAGIGENASDIRAAILEGVEFLGLKVDQQANQTRQKIAEITTTDSTTKAFIIPTNEELVIARDTVRIVEKCKNAGVI